MKKLLIVIALIGLCSSAFAGPLTYREGALKTNLETGRS